MRYFIFPIVYTVMTILVWYFSYQNWQYQWRDLGNGILYSRKYGTYPKEVPFVQGMTLMPGQQTKAKIALMMPDDKETK